MATACYHFDGNWAGLGRVSYAKGKGRREDINSLAGVRYDLGKFYALASQLATRVNTDDTPYQRSAKGDACPPPHRRLGKLIR